MKALNGSGGTGLPASLAGVNAMPCDVIDATVLRMQTRDCELLE